MPATPTTKSQVHAYKFVLRRMESALVRRDAVMLHEPMRGHTRATIVGVILAAALSLGFVLASVLAPSGSIGDKGIVVSKSGAVFVIGQNPKRLIPVPNITSARLLLMSTQNSGGSSVEPVSTVDDSALTTVPHDVMYGMPNAPTMLPDPSNQVSPDWAVCDQANVPSDIEDVQTQLARTTLSTTVLAGIPAIGAAVDPKKTMLVTADASTFYLIYTAQNPAGLGPNSVVRAKIDPSQSDIETAFHEQNNLKLARKISVGLLNSIPEVKTMSSPTVPNLGAKPKWDSSSLGGLTVGQVFKTQITDTQYYVVLPDGIQQVPEVVAELLRIKSGNDSQMRTVQPSDISGVSQAVPAAETLDLSTYPPGPVAAPVGFGDAKASCLTWQYNPATKKVHTAFTLSDSVPAPRGSNTRLVQADQGTGNVQFFYMPGGKAAVVRSITSPQSIADDGTITGPLYLVSDTGVKYGLPSTQIAQGLGLGTDYKPAPEAIMKLLPTGASLDPASATRVFDTIPIDSSNQDHRAVSPSTGNQASSGG